MSNYKLPVKLKPEAWDNGFQTWVKRIYLYSDAGLEKFNDWSLGFYHCEQCDEWQTWSYQIPPAGASDGVSKDAHNEWLDFLLKHAHGDGRVALFERHMP